MNDLDDFEGLDARSLRVLLYAIEVSSVSRAAARLGVTQSSVSHTLDKLRRQFDDPLFVRVGCGIAPTERAVGLEQPLRSILDDLRALTTAPVFDPTNTNFRVTIAVNDFQRDLLLPQASRRANETL